MLTTFLDDNDENAKIRKICAMLYSCREHIAKTADQEKMKTFDAFLKDPTNKQYNRVSLFLHPDKSVIPDAVVYFGYSTEYKDLPEEKKLMVRSAMHDLIDNKEQSYAFLRLGLDRLTLSEIAHKEIDSSKEQAESNLAAAQEREKGLAKAKESGAAQLKEEQQEKRQRKKETEQERDERIKNEREKVEKERVEKEEKNELAHIVENEPWAIGLLYHLEKTASANRFYVDFCNFLEEPTNQGYYDTMLKKLNPADGQRIPGSTVYIEAMDYYKNIRTAQEKLKNREGAEEKLALLQSKESFLHNMALGLFVDQAPTLFQDLDAKAEEAISAAEKAIRDDEKNIAAQNRILNVSNNRDEIELIYALLCDLDKTAKQGDSDVQRALDHFWDKPVWLESDEDLEIDKVFESDDAVKALIISKEADVKLGYGKAIDYYKKLVRSINNLNSKEKLSVQEEKTLETLQNIRKNIREYARNPLEEQTDSGVTLSAVLEKTTKEVKKENIELQALLEIVDDDEKYLGSTALLWHFSKTAEYSHLKSALDNFLIDPTNDLNYKKLIDGVAPNGKPVNNVAAAYLAAIDFYKNLAKTVNMLETRKTNNRTASEDEARKLRYLKQDKKQLADCVNDTGSSILGQKTISARAIEVIEKQKALDIQQQKKPEQKAAMEAEPEPVLFSGPARASSPSIHPPVNPPVATTKAIEAEITDEKWADIKSKVDEAKSKDESIQMSPNENKITVVKAQARIDIERKEREVKVSSSSQDVDYRLLVKNYKITAAILGKEECCIDVSPNAKTTAELIIALDDGEPKIAPVINNQDILTALKRSAAGADPECIEALKIYNKSLEKKANLAHSSAFKSH
ncbi:MAG TPA: hypothetical protein VGU44_04755 [Gammaproteobacteria bacterium]|nr:hypothetical protein [Gammaproteobacteria bacterium]